MILLIDNYDSFSYNLYQLAGTVEPDIRVVRNDALTVADVAALAPDALLISPGPGKPADAGICVEAVRALSGRLPIMGVCLGHQAICEAFGGTVTYASRLMHGKQSQVEVLPGEGGAPSPLFAGLPEPFGVARYHSLALDEATLPAALRVTARSLDDGEVMAVEHVEHPTFGVQFHPESIMTPDGAAIMANFMRIAREFAARER
jgi:anthranilate synthase component 2